LAVIGSASGIGGWLAGSSVWWLVSGMVLGFVAPFTLVVIMPTNKRLASAREIPSDEARALWNGLHAVF
jgi:uncharacterized membrane protein